MLKNVIKVKILAKIAKKSAQIGPKFRRKIACAEFRRMTAFRGVQRSVWIFSSLDCMALYTMYDGV